METSLHKSTVLEGAVEKGNKGSQSSGDEENFGEEIFLQIGAGKITKDDEMKPAASTDQKNLTCSKQGSIITKIQISSPESESRSFSSTKRKKLNEQLESAKSEMDEVMEENQRLRTYLDRTVKEYRTLQKQYEDVVKQEPKTCPNTAPTNHDQTEDVELIALTLGRTSSGAMSDERRKTSIFARVDEGNEGLKLGLECKSQIETCQKPSPENRLEEAKETMKNVRDGGDDETSQQNPAKRARVSVRVRCDTPTMNDGCQWRKYGQKIAKGNPCPRAYYRCTVAPSCPVRKQVQRWADDMSILITTYEGTHNHPLSVSATAMASTTSAAAAMLLSGSSTSAPAPSSSSTTTANLNGLNFSLPHNSDVPKPFYLPNSSISSSSSPHPTITLDLTSTLSSSSSHLSRLGHFPPKYPTTNLNFNPLASSALANSMYWSNGILSYGTPPVNSSRSTSSLPFRQEPNDSETLLQPYLKENNLNPNQQTLAPDAIAAATKAITSDPSFQSALVAALSSIIGSGGTNNATVGNQKTAEKSTQNIK